MKDNVYKILFYIALPIIGALFSMYVRTASAAIDNRVSALESKTAAIAQLKEDVASIKTDVGWMKDQIQRKSSLLPALLAVPSRME